jgi:hypothetical protein
VTLADLCAQLLAGESCVYQFRGTAGTVVSERTTKWSQIRAAAMQLETFTVAHLAREAKAGKRNARRWLESNRGKTVESGETININGRLYLVWRWKGSMARKPTKSDKVTQPKPDVSVTTGQETTRKKKLAAVTKAAPKKR